MKKIALFAAFLGLPGFAGAATFPLGKSASPQDRSAPLITNGVLPAGAAAGSLPAPPKNPRADDRLLARPATAAAATIQAAADLSTYPVDIQAIVRACGGDPRKIFDLIRNHVRFQPYQGFRKSPELVWLTRSGNDADQAHLLLVCLQAAGHDVFFEYGVVFLPSAQMRAWFGADNIAALNNITGSAGYFGGYDPNSDTYGVEQIWCDLVQGEDIIRLHPAYKTYTELPGIDLAAALGYNRAALLTAAAGTETATYAQGVSEPATAAYLSARAGNLVQTLRTNYPNAETDEIVSGRRIVPLSLDANYTASFFTPQVTIEPTYANFGFGNPYGSYTVGGTTYEFAASLIIAVGTLNATGTNFATVLAEYSREAAFFAGKKIVTAFDASGRAGIYVDDVLVAAETGTPTGAPIGVGYLIDHPYRNGSAASFDQLRVVPAKRTGLYVWSLDPGGLDRPELARRRNQNLDTLRRQGLAATSREISSESLFLLGLDWSQQLDLGLNLLAAQQRFVPIIHHTMALIQQEAGFGVDIPSTLVLVARNGVTADTEIFRRAFLQLGSAMEHGVIEQNYPGRRAVSTVRYLRENNLANGRTYRASSANYATIAADPAFQAGWSAGYRQTVFPSALSSGETLILPQNGAITLDQLTGNGYFSYDSVSAAAIINPGALNGGFATTPGLADASLNPLPLDPTFGPEALPNPESLEPIDLYTGAYVYDSADLVLSGAGPRGLAFGRSYSSLAAGRAGLLGPGWSHGYDSAVVTHSDYRAALGDTSPVAAARLIAATWAIGDLARTPDSPKGWVVSSIAAYWALDAIKTNAVTLTLGRRTLPFTQLADGTYAAAPGITATLVKDSATGLYRIDERYGRSARFNAQNRLASLVDNDGKTTTFAYETSGADAGRLRTVTDAYARTLTFAYTSGRLTTVTDSTGRSVTLGYTAGLLTTVTDPAGQASTYAYDSAQRIRQVLNARGELVAENTYDAAGQISTQVAEGDAAQTWLYAFTGALNTETNPDDETTAHTFDAKGRVIAVTDGLGQTARRDYDGQNHLVRLTDAQGRITRFTYDGRHNLRFIYDARNGAAGTTYPRENRYDAADQLQFTIDEAGRQTEYRYDAQFHLTTVIDPLLRQTSLIYYPSGPHDGLVQTQTRPGALAGQTLVTQFTYDAFGYPDQITRADGSVVDSTYNSRGDLTAIQTITTGDARLHAQAFTYDLNRRLLTTADALGYGAATTYDAAGDVSALTDRFGNRATFVHSPFGRLRSQTGPDGQTTLFTYDDTGRPESTANPLNQVTSTAYDAAGRPVTVTDAVNQNVTSAYDAVGNRTTLKNARNQSHTWNYTAVDLPTTHTTPLGRATTTLYDTRNLPATVTEPSAQATTFTYATDARLTKTVDPVGTIDYAYDAQGRLRTVTTGTQVLTRGYDTLDRVNTFTDAAGNTVTYAYDGAGQLKTLTYPGNLAVTYAYDTADRLTTVTDWAGRVTTFTYDGRSRLSRVALPNGTRRTIDYDSAGRVSRRLDEVTATGAVVLDQRTTYDALGRIEQEIVTPEPTSYTLPVTLMSYDADDRLTTWQSGALNLTTASDADGNLTSGPLGAASATFVYDARNRLTAAGSATYAYDAENRRVSKTEGGTTTTYVHDPHAGLSRLLSTTTGGATTRYVYAGSLLLYEVNGTAVRAYHSDTRGSTRAMTDPAGAVLGRATYGPYGEPVVSTLPATPFRYNGAYSVQTDTNGLLQMRARYYSPQTRRFLNADPIGFSGGLNWYAYANGNPVMYVDPSGYVAWGDLGSATLGIAGNGLGLAAGFLLGIAPEPTMVTKVAAVAVVGKSSYGFGVSVQNAWAALKDESPVSKGSLANDVADLVAPGNQKAQYAATAIDLASDLALGRIGSNHAQSLAGQTVRGANGFPLYDMQYQTVNDFATLGRVSDAFTVLSVGQTAFDTYRSAALPPFGANIGGGGSGGGCGSMTNGRK